MKKSISAKKITAIGLLSLAASFNAFAAPYTQGSPVASPYDQMGKQAPPTVSAADLIPPPFATIPAPKIIEWSEFLAENKKGSYYKIDINADNYYVVGYYYSAANKDYFKVQARRSITTDKVYEELQKNMPVDGKKVSINFPEPPPAPLPPPPEKKGFFSTLGSTLYSLLLNPLFLAFAPLLLIIGIIVYFAKNAGKQQMKGAKGKGFIPVKPEDNHVRFKDVAGIDEVRKEVQEVLDFIQNPDKFYRVGAKPPRGILMTGDPGVGKTLIAKALAGEGGVPFFATSGSEFVEMFVGLGASRVRDLFVSARKELNSADTPPAVIVFIDEIDVLGKKRGDGSRSDGGNDEREQTLNQFLVEMDGFTERDNIILIAATNRPQLLDPALMRSGRFDRKINVPLPDRMGRFEILKVHTRNKPLHKDVDLLNVAKITGNFSGADLANVANEAAIFAANLNLKQITAKNFLDAIDKINMGLPGRISKNDKEKQLIAIHEMGHVIAMLLHEKNGFEMNKVTIVPRMGSGGHASWVPAEDAAISSKTLGYYHAAIRVAVAGRVAEEVIFGEDNITVGAGSDIQSATRMARAMVSKLGMTKEFGMVHYAENALGHLANEDAVNEMTKKIITDAQNYMREVLLKNKEQLIIGANILIDRETMSAAEVKEHIKLESIEDPRTKNLKPGFGFKRLPPQNPPKAA